MEPGVRSIRRAVKALEVSRQFYEKFDFKPFGGYPSWNWLILKHGDHVVDLFQGMFDKHILAFNSDWDQHARPQAVFIDVRELQRQLTAQGAPLKSEADERTTDPARFMVENPDGNPTLVEPHVRVRWLRPRD